jgi:probable HAF family extracellular repeat protein
MRPIRAGAGIVLGLCVCAEAQPTYRIVDLADHLDPMGYPVASGVSVNNAGQTVGSAFGFADDYEHGVIWDGEESVQLLGLLPEDNSSGARRIENDGVVCGLSNFVEIIDNGHLIIITEDQKATEWVGGVPMNLNDMVTGGATYIDLRIANDRTDDGTFIGFGRSFGEPPYTSYGFMLGTDGTVTDLGALTEPLAANESGQIVGYGGGQAHAYLWDNGNLTDLHLNQGFTGVTSRAWAISEDGVILGEAQFDISKPEEPTAWIDGKAERLVPEVTRPQGVATGANSAGVIVGYYNDLDDLNSDWMSFRIDDGVRTDLFDLLDDVDGWTSLLALDINDKGWIVGYGVHNNQLGRAFLMIPTCVADFNGDGTLNILDFIALQNAFKAGNESADINCDGALNILDFIAFQDLFKAGCA